MIWLTACTLNEPILVAHRALGVVEDAEENQPNHVVAAFEQGFGAEIDIRLDGDGCSGDPSLAEVEGCFDLGHTEPNGHTLANVVDAVWALPELPSGRPLILDIVNDPDHLTVLQLLAYLASVDPLPLPVVVQTSSAEGLAMLDALRNDSLVDGDLSFALTYFTNPEFTAPAGADLIISNIAELPASPMPVPVAVFGVATESAWSQAVYAASDVRWVITDFPGRFAD